MSLAKKFKDFFGPKKTREDSSNSGSRTPNRAPRVRITALHRIYFRTAISTSQPKKDFLISNISATGLGLVGDSNTEWPDIGCRLNGELCFDQDRFSIQLEIVHIANTVAGCRFHSDNQLQQFLLRYFRVEVSAVRMIQVNPDILQPEVDGMPRLFRGHDNCELFLVENKGVLVRFHLVFFGNHIESTASGSTKFSERSESLQGQEMDAAFKFIRNIEGLPIDLCEAICERLEQLKSSIH